MNIFFAVLFTACASAAVSVSDPFQLPFNTEFSHPDFYLDLNASRLVQMEAKAPVWMTELEKIQVKAQGIPFFDITETQELESLNCIVDMSTVSFPSPNMTEKVKHVLKTLSTRDPMENLQIFTNFRTRHYLSHTGRKSQQWLLSRIGQITASGLSVGLQDRISLTEFPHSWGQNTIIVRIKGFSTQDDGVVIIGAHQDSTNRWPFWAAPGADDDGSGTVAILEAYRALIIADFRPLRTVEFHWYSAEEGGLLGSRAVALDYRKRSVNVLAMSQFDMTAWVKEGTREEVGVITDFTDDRLTTFGMGLIETYLDIPHTKTKCGYACSDHASWRLAGYPSAFFMESSTENANPYRHTAKDRIDISGEFSFTHLLEFSKLAVAFAIELGGWTK